MNRPNPWRDTPTLSKVLFLLAVFFVFVGIGVANDVTDMGRVPWQRYAMTAVLNGLFAVCYASGGIILRKRFWKLFVPLLVLQFFCMAALGHWFPDEPARAALNTAATARLQNRLVLDGTLIIASVCLGYAGFVVVSIREGRRYLQTQLEKATLESEMAAAREVQQVMVPEALPTVSGYAIESVYRPAAEVGGDFFQVIPLRSGRTLVVIGDVSGKGLRAAMIVSMIVGMLRAVSGFTEEPAEILAELNRRLAGRLQGAFATCLVMRLEEQGRIVFANAGHPPLYLNGAEFPFSGSMPLGLLESSAYEQAELEMRMGDRVMLVTDGIAEARDRGRVLFGFSRVESLVGGGASVRSVADTAQEYGQEDDLTVIGIARTA
jgi:hypothetical protein